MAWCRTCRIFKLVEADLPLHICIFGLCELADLKCLSGRKCFVLVLYTLEAFQVANKHVRLFGVGMISKGGVSETGTHGDVKGRQIFRYIYITVPPE